MHLALGDVPFVPAVWDAPCVKRLACVNLFSLQQKIAPFSVEDGAIRLFKTLVCWARSGQL